MLMIRNLLLSEYIKKVDVFFVMNASQIEAHVVSTESG
jgi:hypothetical protein